MEKIYSQKKTEQWNFWGNMIGSTIYALVTVLLYIPVTWVCNPAQAGQFAIAYTLAQTLYYVGTYNIREYQVTDRGGRKKIGQYIFARGLTVLCMLLLCIGWIVIHDYQKEKIMLMLVLCIFKMTDAYADVIEGYFQCDDRLYLSGIFLAGRTLLPAILFTIVLFSTKQLLFSTICLSVFSIVCVLVFDITEAAREGLYQRCSRRDVAKLLTECFPLFVGGFMIVYMLNAEKYAVDACMESQYQTYFNILFMPTFLINLLSGFIFKPYLVRLSAIWEEKDVKSLKKFLYRMTICIMILTLIMVAGGVTIGIPILARVYNMPEIYSYRFEFCILLIGGGISAFTVLQYNVLTTMRKQKQMCICYLEAAAITLIGSYLLVRRFGLLGGAAAYVLSYTILTLLFSVLLKKQLCKS